MNDTRNKNWNEQLVTEEIRSWQELGKPLYSHYMRQNYQELLAAGIRYFGTWRAAIEASGIPYDSVRKYRDWSKERIVETIVRLEKDGVDLSFRSMMLSKYAPMVYASIRPNHFGSWKDALTAAGLTPSDIYRYRSWDDDSILSEIRRLKSEGADLSSKKMDEIANPLIATARRRFGNWGAAVERAGIDYSAIRRRRRWTRELVLSEIRDLRKAGADLRSGEIRHANPALFAAACKARFFGSWTKALQAADETVTREVAEVATPSVA
jgi:Homing endonuclease associated repeat